MSLKRSCWKLKDLQGEVYIFSRFVLGYVVNNYQILFHHKYENKYKKNIEYNKTWLDISCIHLWYHSLWSFAVVLPIKIVFYDKNCQKIF